VRVECESEKCKKENADQQQQRSKKQVQSQKLGDLVENADIFIALIHTINVPQMRFKSAASALDSVKCIVVVVLVLSETGECPESLRRNFEPTKAKIAIETFFLFKLLFRMTSPSMSIVNCIAAATHV